MSYSYQSHRKISPGICPSSEIGMSINPERLRSMLEALGHARLLDLVTDLAARQPRVYVEIRDMLRSDPTQRRLFVRGLPRTCTNQDLIDVFSVFGPIDEAVVMKQKGSQCCKGFGFVTFADAFAADAAIQQPEKMIAGRMAIASLAAIGNKNKPKPMSQDAAGLPAPGTYASSQLYHAPMSSFTRTASGNPHKRHRNELHSMSLSSYGFYPPATSSQYHADEQHQYDKNVCSQTSLEKYRNQDSSYSDRVPPYSEQLRF